MLQQVEQPDSVGRSTISLPHVDGTTEHESDQRVVERRHPVLPPAFDGEWQLRHASFGQQIRDRNREALDGPPRIPPKVGSWDGHPDILPWNELMRDEFDNAQEMIRVLESGGADLLARAASPRDEDSFLLGPDVVGALRKKCKVMRDHWLDVESYLAPPHK